VNTGYLEGFESARLNNPHTLSMMVAASIPICFDFGTFVVSRVRDRRYVAVDRERGIVFAFSFFDHEPINCTWQFGELLKFENGQIFRMEAVFH
jgi:hypothetical protein